MITDYNNIIYNIQAELTEYLKKSGLKSLVLGISGGIDSAVSAALAYPVCKKLGVKLIGRSITIITNKPDEIARAKLIGQYFTTNFREVDLSDGFQQLEKLIVEDIEQQDRADKEFKIRLGNVKARTRMIYIYDLASKNKGMVLSTDNYTELLLGFWTLHGDVGDYGMIQNLWKTEVYELSRYLAAQMENREAAKALIDCVTAVPTDGLGITNSDLEQIGAATYEEVDEILIAHLADPTNAELAKHPVIQRKLRSEFKRNNPFNLSRATITQQPQN